ncbi:MAG: hypothetical protein R3A11_07975 [Bdellovibrionota bacterium]
MKMFLLLVGLVCFAVIAPSWAHAQYIECGEITISIEYSNETAADNLGVWVDHQWMDYTDPDGEIVLVGKIDPGRTLLEIKNSDKKTIFKDVFHNCDDWYIQLEEDGHDRELPELNLVTKTP